MQLVWNYPHIWYTAVYFKEEGSTTSTNEDAIGHYRLNIARFHDGEDFSELSSITLVQTSTNEIPLYVVMPVLPLLPIMKKLRHYSLK